MSLPINIKDIIHGHSIELERMKLKRRRKDIIQTDKK